MALYSPLEGDNWGECVIQQGHPAPGPNDRCGSTWDRVSPGFLASMGVPIVRGRDLSISDTANAPFVAVVNETFAKKFFPKQDPIGQHFGIDFPQYSGTFEIVGVYRDFKMNNPRDPVRPSSFVPSRRFTPATKKPPLISTETQSMLDQFHGDQLQRSLRRMPRSSSATPWPKSIPTSPSWICAPWMHRWPATSIKTGSLRNSRASSEFSRSSLRPWASTA